MKVHFGRRALMALGLLAALTVLCFFSPAPIQKVAIATNSSSTVSASLEIRVDTQDTLTGTLFINASETLTHSISSYILLPFEIRNIQTNSNKHIQVALSVTPNGFSILHLILAPTFSTTAEVFFIVIPRIVKTGELSPADLNRASNYLIIEDLGKSERALYCRYSADEKAFGELSAFSDEMLLLQEIKFIFSEGTKFISRPPSTVTSNILDGGLQNGFTFVTTPDFYKDSGKFLWINYLPPLSLLSISIRQTFATLGLVALPGLVIFLLTFQSYIPKKPLLALVIACLCFSVIIVSAILFLEGVTFLIETINDMIVFVVVYVVGSTILLIVNAKEIWTIVRNILSRLLAIGKKP